MFLGLEYGFSQVTHKTQRERPKEANLAKRAAGAIARAASTSAGTCARTASPSKTTIFKWQINFT
jgi:hypothetical protein